MTDKKLCFSRKCVKTIAIFILVIFFLIGYYAVSNFLVENNISKDTKAIVNGSIAPDNKYPYFVKLSTSTGKCGGVLISNLYVLTSAHCVYEVYIKGGAVTIMIGVNTYSGLYRGHYIWYVNHASNNQNIFIPKEYKPVVLNGVLDYDYDIALIRLNNQHAWKIPTASFPGPSAFPEKTNIGKQATIIGVGSTSRYLYALSKNLNEANVYIRDSNNKGVITLNSMDESVKKSACWGDSGGPAIYYIANKIYVIGVAKSGYCYVNSLYTSTSFNSKWITDTTGILPDSGDATLSQIVPTQQPLVNICYSRWDEIECYRFNEFCRWDTTQKKCFPR